MENEHDDARVLVRALRDESDPVNRDTFATALMCYIEDQRKKTRGSRHPQES